MKTVQTRVTRSRKAVSEENSNVIVKPAPKKAFKNLKDGKKTKKVLPDDNCDVPVKLVSKKAPKDVNNRKYTRKALADVTNSNSGSDLNVSSSPSKKNEVLKTNSFNQQVSRPKRAHQLPSRFQDHEISPVSKKKNVDSLTSTPLSSSIPEVRKSLITCKLSPIEEPTSEDSSNRSNCSQTEKSNNKKVIDPDENILKPKRIKATPNNSRFVENKNTTVSKPQLRSKVNKKTSEKILVFEKKSNKSSISSRSLNCSQPVYKKNIIGDNLQVKDKSALYEFEYDPTNEPKTTIKKKKNAVKTNVVKKKKKKMSRKSADLAMQNLIEDLKKIQEKKMMKKLVDKIESRKKSNIKTNASDNLQPVPNMNLQTNPVAPRRDSIEERPPSPFIENYPPSPIIENHPPSPIIESHLPLPLIENNVNVQNVAVSNHSINSHNNASLRFSNNPMANSSAIVDDKPNCSPWRMNLDSDVKKWRYNFYVKPSMTPAYERDTFHVIGLDNNSIQNYDNSNLNEVNVVSSVKPVEENMSKSKEVTTKMLQTSILSFYANAIRKSPQKRAISSKNKLNTSNSFKYAPHFDFNNDNNNDFDAENESIPNIDNHESENTSVPKENIEPAIENYFGFDDNLEEIDQENISPIPQKKSPEKRIQRIKKINNNIPIVLQEISNRKNVTRSQAKQKIPDVLEKKNSPKKSAIIEETSNETRNSDESPEANENTTLNESAVKEFPLFEDPTDVEIVHYNKPTRRSYERKRKMPVRYQNTLIINDVEKDNESEPESNENVKYVVSAKTVKKRKIKKSQPMSKKEEKEAAEWAAGFNSMLEEVEEFPLCVE